MRAVLVDRFTQVESLKIVDVPDPDIASGQVLIDLKAAGIGFVDRLKIAGLYQTKDLLPFVPGMEFSGVVCRSGEGSAKVKNGDRVFGTVKNGALAEKLAVSVDDLDLMPPGLSFAQAAAVPVNYLTAMYGLRELAGLSAGQNLLVLGAAGGVGTAAIKVAKMLGATVFAAASTADKRAFAEAEGADATVDYTNGDWREELKRLSGGAAMDVIFDGIGGDISPVAFRTLGWRGRHLVVGFAAGEIPRLPMNIALLKGAMLVGVDSAQVQRREPETYARIMDDLSTSLGNGSLAPPPVQEFPFDAFQEAFSAIRERRARGKVVINFG